MCRNTSASVLTRRTSSQMSRVLICNKYALDSQSERYTNGIVALLFEDTRFKNAFALLMLLFFFFQKIHSRVQTRIFIRAGAIPLGKMQFSYLRVVPLRNLNCTILHNRARRVVISSFIISQRKNGKSAHIGVQRSLFEWDDFHRSSRAVCVCADDVLAWVNAGRSGTRWEVAKAKVAIVNILNCSLVSNRNRPRIFTVDDSPLLLRSSFAIRLFTHSHVHTSIRSSSSTSVVVARSLARLLSPSTAHSEFLILPPENRRFPSFFLSLSLSSWWWLNSGW